jgi:hypothetical protein
MSIKLGFLASSQQQAATLLLDIYPGASAAYSLRKLRTAYTGNAIRVRRSSDNTETDIGFNGSGAIDTTALLTFCGLSSGFISIWYDQSGNSENQIQNTAGNQPQIVANGSLILENTKPCTNFNFPSGSSQFMSTTTASFNSIQTTIIAVNRSGLLGPAGIFQRLVCIGAFNSGYYLGGNGFLDNMLAVFNGSALTCFGGTISVQNLSISYNNATTGFLNNNGSQVSSITTSVSSYGNQKLFIASDSANNSAEYWKGTIQEVVVYPVNQSANIAGIQTNINSFYTIF